VLYCICPISLNNCLSITAAAETVLTVAEAAAILLCHPHPATRKNAALSLSLSLFLFRFHNIFAFIQFSFDTHMYGMECSTPTHRGQLAKRIDSR
jgi:hypothetical protein